MRGRGRSVIVSRCVRGIDGRGLHVTNLEALRTALLRWLARGPSAWSTASRCPDSGTSSGRSSTATAAAPRSQAPPSWPRSRATATCAEGRSEASRVGLRDERRLLDAGAPRGDRGARGLAAPPDVVSVDRLHAAPSRAVGRARVAVEVARRPVRRPRPGRCATAPPGRPRPGGCIRLSERASRSAEGPPAGRSRPGGADERPSAEWWRRKHARDVPSTDLEGVLHMLEPEESSGWADGDPNGIEPQDGTARMITRVCAQPLRARSRSLRRLATPIESRGPTGPAPCRLRVSLPRRTPVRGDRRPPGRAPVPAAEVALEDLVSRAGEVLTGEPFSQSAEAAARIGCLRRFHPETLGAGESPVGDERDDSAPAP